MTTGQHPKRRETDAQAKARAARFEAEQRALEARWGNLPRSTSGLLEALFALRRPRITSRGLSESDANQGNEPRRLSKRERERRRLVRKRARAARRVNRG